MIRIAIVEDDKNQAALLENHIKQFAKHGNKAVDVRIFYNVINFLDPYTADYDIVFMDIMMPMMNGMDASRVLREKDENVMLIFVTSMRQYAVQGYEVDAADFIVKPVSYLEFALKFTRALARLEKGQSKTIVIKTKSGFVRLSPDQITYVEVSGHYCVFHTKNSEYKQYQTIKNVEANLNTGSFERCNNYLLVNLAYVEKIDGMSVFVGGDELQISNPRKKAFTEAFAKYMESKKYD